MDLKPKPEDPPSSSWVQSPPARLDLPQGPVSDLCQLLIAPADLDATLHHARSLALRCCSVGNGSKTTV